MKSITFIIRSLRFGGAERVVSVLSNRLICDYSINVITFNKEKQEYRLNEHIHRYNLDLSCSSKRLLSDIFKLRNTCKNINSDIYISFDTLANIYSALAMLLSNKILGISERNAPKEVKYKFHTKLLRKILYKTADFYIFQTKQAAEYYSSSIQKKSYIIPNPVKEELPEKQYYDIRKEIIAIGRLTYQKGYDLLLEAFSEFVKEHQDYKLIIYGEGELLEQYKKKCVDLKISNSVVFAGNNINVHDCITKSELFVLSSHFEGIPNALLETMAMGFPVISTDCPVGGPRLLIDNYKNGILLEKNDVEHLANAMNYMISNKKEAIEMGKQAKNVRVKYSVENICNIWKQVIETESCEVKK